MKSGSSPNGPEDSNRGRDGGVPAGADGGTGLPVLRTWRAVYLFVLVLFAVDILLLIALEKVFS